MISNAVLIGDVRTLLSAKTLPVQVSPNSELGKLMLDGQAGGSWGANEKFTWEIILVALDRYSDELDPSPLLAARHLLGEFPYPDNVDVPFGRRGKTLRNYGAVTEGNVIRTPRGPLSLVLRQTIAAGEGGYGKSRFPMISSAKRFGEVAEALLVSIRDVLASPSAVDRAWSAALADKSAFSSSSHPSAEGRDSARHADDLGRADLLDAEPVIHDSRMDRRSNTITSKRAHSARFWTRKRKLLSKVWDVAFLPLLLAAAVGSILAVTFFMNLSADFQAESSTPAALSSIPSTTPTGEIKSGATAEYSGGWGPDRPTFTWQTPAPYAVLNSISNNPGHGDEREFVQVRQSKSPNGTFANIVRAEPGDELTVYVFVMNDAGDNLANSAATIHDLRARLFLERGDKDVSLAVTLIAANAKDVWDGASVVSSAPIDLSFVPGSVNVTSRDSVYTADDDEMFESKDGMLLGYQQQDGLMPVGWAENGTNEFSFYVMFKVRVSASGGTAGDR
jgi:hypothetical protein